MQVDEHVGIPALANLRPSSFLFQYIILLLTKSVICEVYVYEYIQFNIR